jgi:tRNA threonylcarbamoyladenosine biosynthesis protein TsaE
MADDSICRFTANDEADTQHLGAVLADLLPAGTVVALIGPLGAGKTRLVQAIATAMGVPRDTVTSPTFVLINEYGQGRIPIFHFDAYRLNNINEFAELGPEEYFELGGICLIEWADRVAELLPNERLEVTIEVLSDVARRFTFTASGEAMAAACAGLGHALSAEARASKG